MTRPPSIALERLHRLGPYAGVGLLLALLWSLVLGFSAVQQQRLLDDAHRSLDLITRALTAQTAAVLRDAEVDLQVVDAWMQAHPSVPPERDTDLARLMAAMNQASAGVIELQLADLASAHDQSVRDGLPLRSDASGSGSGSLRLSLGAPMHAAAAHRRVLPLALRSERGGVLALIDLDKLIALHESLRLRPAGSISLIRSDGVVLSRVPPVPGLVGRNIATGAPQVAAALARPEGSTIYSGSVTDGVRRLMNYRQLADYPLSVFVSQGYDDALATYNERRNLVMGICAAISVIVIALTVVLARSQRRARERQAELAAVSDESPLGMFRAGLDGRMTYVNDAYLRIQGLQREEAADGWLQLIRPEAREQVREQWQRIVRTREPFDAERRLQLRDGREVLVSVRSQAVVVDGQVTGHVGTVRDITERAATEKALRTLTTILDATSDLVVQTDTRGRMRYMNPAARRSAGLAPDASVAHLTITDFFPAQAVQRLLDEIVPVAVERGVWIGESTLHDAERGDVPYSHMVIAHKDAAGEVDYFSGILRDISADKAAQHAVQRSEATMRSVAEAIPTIVAVVGRDERYRYANSAFERWHGTGRDAIVGRSLRDVLGEADYARSRHAIERTLAGELVTFERTYTDRERYRHLQVSYIPLRMADGSIDGFVSLAHDISEHKREEARLLEMTRLDPLTGALNRAGFENVLVQRTQRHADDMGDGLLALLYIDLDRFKEVNDRHGHPVGDELLRIFVARLRNVLRPSDALARLGGDEFAVVLDGLRAPANAEQVAEKVLGVANAPFRIEALELQVGASIGIALWREGDAGWQSMVQRADEMLYRAKQAGRGRYRASADS